MGWEKAIGLVLGLLVVTGAVAVLWPLARRSFIYPGGELAPQNGHPSRHGLPDSEVVWLETEDGLRLHAWWTPAAPPIEAGPAPLSGAAPADGSGAPTARGAVIYCHGNAESLATRWWIARRLADRGFDVLLFDYRGYGLSEGRPTEPGLRRDAEAAWRHVVEGRGHDPGRVVLMGHSLGSAVATRLALDLRGPSRANPPQAPAALVLGSPFSDMPSLFKHHAGWLPGFALRWRTDRLDAGSRLGEVRVPVLVIVGTGDELIPPAFSDAVYAAAREPKTRADIPADHGTLMGHPQTWAALDAFLDGTLRGAGPGAVWTGPE